MELVRNYKTVLKNEVPVLRKPMDELFAKYNIYVFGYGSLLSAEGWEGRGMRHPPERKDLIECMLKGFERGPFGVFERFNFYGILRKTGRKCNGVLAPVVDLRDWVNLMVSEHVAGLTDYVNYRVIDVTDDVDEIADVHKMEKPFKIHAVCNRPGNRDKMLKTIPYPRYYSSVMRGILRERSQGFAKDFLATGGFQDQLDVVQFLDKEGGFDEC